MKGKIASIEIGNKKFYIGAVMSFLDAIALSHRSIDFSRYNRLRYMVGEVLKRRIESAYPGGDGLIAVDFILAESYFEVSIRDKGIPSWTTLSRGTEVSTPNDAEQLSNRLLDFMTDDFGMEKLGKDGQRIFIRMNILHKIVFEKPEPYPDIEVLDTNISIKAVETPEEAIEAIRCIYSEYGYSYSYERLYYIDSFMKAIKNKEIMSFLAVNDHGQVAGHFALAFSDTFKSMPEVSTVVTRKEFRGLGLFSKFMDHCIKVGKECGVRALMGQPVAFHPYSQKAFIKSGFTASALLLSYIPSDVESEYNKNNERLDLFASVKILDETAHTVIYPPEEITAFADNVFKRAGYRYEVGESNTLCESTAISVETNLPLKSTKMILNGAGEDLEQILQDSIKGVLRGKIEMVELLISMNDSSCRYAYEIAKQCGFVFAGIIPGSENADYLVMQMLVGSDCRYDQLVVVGDYEEIKNHIMLLNKQREEL